MFGHIPASTHIHLHAYIHDICTEDLCSTMCLDNIFFDKNSFNCNPGQPLQHQPHPERRALVLVPRLVPDHQQAVIRHHQQRHEVPGPSPCLSDLHVKNHQARCTHVARMGRGPHSMRGRGSVGAPASELHSAEWPGSASGGAARIYKQEGKGVE